MCICIQYNVYTIHIRQTTQRIEWTYITTETLLHISILRFLFSKPPKNAKVWYHLKNHLYSQLLLVNGRTEFVIAHLTAQAIREHLYRLLSVFIFEFEFILAPTTCVTLILLIESNRMLFGIEINSLTQPNERYIHVRYAPTYTVFTYTV